jgi:hypothetical protein
VTLLSAIPGGVGLLMIRRVSDIGSMMFGHALEVARRKLNKMLAEAKVLRTRRPRLSMDQDDD